MEPNSSEGGSSSKAPSQPSQSEGNQMEKKVFNDPIHGSMEFHPFLIKIINTREFERLRNIKQLGGGYYVYPGASHNRFEHSLGVAHLAGDFARSLQKTQPELKISERDVLCVEIAGLCHDLGHGPFSHLFDRFFIPKVRNDLKKWEHEKASVQIFRHIVDELKNKGFDLLEELKKVDINSMNESKDNDLRFISEMIIGNSNGEYEGRQKDKHFLYEIVANKRTGIDVDKFDYFARDCHHLGITNSFDHRRFFKFARVCKVESKPQICIRDKELSNIYEMFHTRSRLHLKAYQHKTNKIIELMITEAFIKADPILEMSKVINEDGDVDIEQYIKLTDDIFGKILHSEEEELREAKEILERIVSRDIYKCLGKTKSPTPLTEKETQKENWKKELANALGIQEYQLDSNDFEINIATIDFGMKQKNPMDHLHFYNKFDKTNAFKIPTEQVSDFLLPKNFSEDWIYVYCKSSAKRGVANKHFVQWCKNKEKKGFLPPLSQEGLS